MKNSILLILALSCCIIFSCNNQSEEEKILEEVIEIHDAVMPEMQTIFQLRKELMAKRDSLDEIGANPEIIKEVEMRMDELSKANEDMMQWMRDFDGDFEGDENLSRIEYLKLEREKIQDVNTGFELAIENARATLASIS